MKKLLSLCILLLLLSGFAFGQFHETREIDSLKTELVKTSIGDTTKIALCLNLAAKYRQFNLDSVEKYSKLGHKISKSSTKYYLGRTYAQLGSYHMSFGRMDSARYNYKKGIEFAEKNADTTFQINVLRYYLASLSDGTNFEEKVELNLKIIKLAELKNYRLSESQYQLAALYGYAGFDKLAIKYSEEALKNVDEDDKNGDVTRANIIINLLYYELRNPKLDVDKIEAYLSELSALCTKSKLPIWCHYYYAREGTYFDAIEEFDKAEISLDNSLEEAKKLNKPFNLMFAYICLGEHFVKANNPKKAIENFKKFSKIISDQSIPDMEVWAYENWAKAEKMSGNFENANTYLEKYLKLNDTINSKKNKIAIANAETKYQSEKKDKEIAEQQLELADQQLAIQESKSKTRTMTILIVSLLLGSILLWFSFNQRQKRMQQQLVSIEREQEIKTLESLMEGEEKERLRIAKELHDGVNGDLSAIKFKLVSLLETNNTVINEAVTMIDNSCEQVRSISHNLVPPSLRDFDLLEAVEVYCDDMNAIHKPEINFQHVGDPIVLEKKQEANLFRIIQELVTNSIKHAGAKEILVQLSNIENNLQLTVEDDGKGFDINNIKSDGIGMQNIRSRVAYLDGKMDVKSDSKGSSFTIYLSDNAKKT
ncbi:sensor histidine kinase [Zobellia nedashkovskayae]|uniref:tetratricopeptide repeat-containing sensor histidine kinase n=1 Tax=Zobellia nedashkovskayae TaxID=2779510 RepID=UPI00188AEF70|nr:sensor histidine kinase [Zobellia nedashkovskayae]